MARFIFQKNQESKNHVTTSGLGAPFLIKTYVTIALFLESLRLSIMQLW